MRSSCAGFSSTCCLADFHASAISAFLLTGAAARCFLFARRCYWQLRRPCSPFPLGLQCCGDALAAKARCGLSSDSPQTSFAGNQTLWLGALTVHRSRQLLACLAPLWRRAATGVSTPQNHPLCRPSCSVPMSDFVPRHDRSRIPAAGKSSFPRALLKESVFKPHR